MKQSDAVYQATHAVLKEAGITFEDKVDNIKNVITTELRKQVIVLVSALLHAGKAAFSDKARVKYPTEEIIRKDYTPGMVSNWYRKDLRWNGNVKYEALNPGSRAGSGDPEVKNLKLLIASGKLSAEQSAIATEAMEARKDKLRAEKTKVEVDYSKIPSDLLDMLGIGE